jgi:uncharacterized membrane protein YdbT with pleckstrin-like domain
MHEILFPSQQPNEKILIVVREHWFRLLVKIAVVGIISLVPGVIKLLIDTETISSSPLVDPILNTLIAVFYLALLVTLFIIFVLYYLNMHIVSEERIVDIDQRGLLFHEISELNIETIEDVTSQTKGLFGNLLNYGTVYIQTAGTAQKFEFDNVPNPGHIAKVILELYEAHGRKEQPKT